VAANNGTVRSELQLTWDPVDMVVLPR